MPTRWLLIANLVVIPAMLGLAVFSLVWPGGWWSPWCAAWDTLVAGFLMGQRSIMHAMRT